MSNNRTNCSLCRPVRRSTCLCPVFFSQLWAILNNSEDASMGQLLALLVCVLVNLHVSSEVCLACFDETYRLTDGHRLKLSYVGAPEKSRGSSAFTNFFETLISPSTFRLME